MKDALFWVAVVIAFSPFLAIFGALVWMIFNDIGPWWSAAIVVWFTSVFAIAPSGRVGPHGVRKPAP